MGAGSETLGIPDISIASRKFSFTTLPFYNKDISEVTDAMHLEKWLLCPYKFYTLWIRKYGAITMTHDTPLGSVVINPTTYYHGHDAIMRSNENLYAIPVKVENMGSIEHQFTENPYRKYTIEMRSIRKYSFEEVYNLGGE